MFLEYCIIQCPRSSSVGIFCYALFNTSSSHTRGKYNMIEVLYAPPHTSIAHILLRQDTLHPPPIHPVILNFGDFLPFFVPSINIAVIVVWNMLQLHNWIWRIVCCNGSGGSDPTFEVPPPFSPLCHYQPRSASLQCCWMLLWGSLLDDIVVVLYVRTYKELSYSVQFHCQYLFSSTRCTVNCIKFEPSV